MTTESSPTRAHEHLLAIAAAPETVWRSITEAEELVRWFPLGAQVKPGKGGEILYRWGELEGRCRILEWQPPRHLKTGWMEAPATAAGEAERATLAVDWFLEADRGSTVLRVVHSGFHPGAHWDKEYEGTKRGWTFELQALKHYLERQRGKERRAAWMRRVVDCRPSVVWERFARPGPLFRRVALDFLRVGERYRLERADGEMLVGRVLVNHAPLEFAGTLESHRGGMLRFGFEDCMGAPEAHVWLATWGIGAKEFAALETGWKVLLERSFPG
jgi:uncharacterized protein YndB with AHSA1/START domain